jgi:hypothetical protein
VNATAAPKQAWPVARQDIYSFKAKSGERVVEILDVLENDTPRRFLKISGATTTSGNRGRISVIRQGTTLRYVLPRFFEAFGTVTDVFT